ncbi:MAG: hypothetical protein HYS74_01240 [Parcubacteria group bacterium]|nr:hypothetical protein [Parcubacteria group bacterium]
MGPTVSTEQVSVRPTVYIAINLRTSGPDLHKHSILALGAAVVTSSPLSPAELFGRALCFYAELSPRTLNFDRDALRIACRGLGCFNLYEHRNDPRVDPEDWRWDPDYALQALTKNGTPSGLAIKRVVSWANIVRGDHDIEPVFDTTIFDPPFWKFYLDLYAAGHPFGWRGLQLKSFWEGRTSLGNSLKNLDIDVHDLRPNHARSDAIFLARCATRMGIRSAGY